jgi:DNA-binding transcriptional ArsR family regulator/predicted enzyme related to lactoylglutathione lyase
MHAFSVLADPVRRRIVEMLSGGERSAGDVVEAVGGEFGIGQSAVSQHLKVLRDHGFARVQPVGARRVYALEPSAVDAVDRWLEGVRGFWRDRLDDLAADVEGRPSAPRTERAGSPEPAGATRSIGPITQITRTVRDLAASKAFYGTALGLTHLGTAATTAVFDAGGTRLVLTERDPPAADESTLAFAVSDLQASVDRLRSAGVSFAGPPRFRHDPDGGGVWTADFRDPEGRPLSIVARSAP